MTKSIRVLVSCGAGMATSTIVAEEIKDIMKKENIQGTISKLAALSLTDDNVHNYDVIFITTMYKLPEDVKWANVSALISGIGEEKCREQIVKLLHEAADN